MQGQYFGGRHESKRVLGLKTVQILILSSTTCLKQNMWLPQRKTRWLKSLECHHLIMVLHSCSLRNEGVAANLASLLQPPVLVTVCGCFGANSIRMLDIEQNEVIHEVLMTSTLRTTGGPKHFKVAYAIPILKHQTVACVLARGFYGLTLFDVKTGCVQKTHDMGSHDGHLRTAHVPHE